MVLFNRSRIENHNKCCSHLLFSTWFLLTLILLNGCALGTRQRDMSVNNNSIQKSLKEKAVEGAKRWFFGPGIGETAYKVGASFAFPPAAVYFVGNSVLNAVGYKGFYVTELLPDPHKRIVQKNYYNVVSLPGTMTSTLARIDFQDGSQAKPSHTTQTQD